MKRSYLRFAIPLIVFGVIALFLFKGLGMNQREITSPLIGKSVPSFSLPLLQQPETRISNKDLLGKPYLLNVWATWCVSCRAEHAHLVTLANTHQIDIYGIDWKDERPAALNWLQRLGNPYQAVAFDKVGRTAIDLGVYGAPETFVVDRHGKIRYKLAGPVSPELIDETLLPLIAKLKKEG